MKKNGLLLLAGTAMLLTGCGGKKYTNVVNLEVAGVKTNISQELTVKTSSFSLSTETEMAMSGAAAVLTGEYTLTYKGVESGTLEVVEDKENTYKCTTTKITISGYECEGAGAEAVNGTQKLAFMSIGFTEAEAFDILEGKKVTIELAEDEYVTSYAVVNTEKMTFTAA